MITQLFTNKNFMLLMQGKAVSLLGSLLQSFALSLYVLNKYHSATLFASMLMVTVIPRLILGPIAGVFVDRFDRKKMIVILDVINGLLITGFAFLFFMSPTLPLWSIYGIVIAMALVYVLFEPASSTVIPLIMKDKELFDANTVDQLLSIIVKIIAPILGGMLLGIVGLGVILILNAISYFISAVTEMFINIPKTDTKKEALSFNVFRRDFSEGLLFFKEKKVLVHIMVLSLIANFVVFPIASVGIPIFLKNILNVSDIQFGLFEGILVGSSIIAMVVASKVGKMFSLEKIIRINAVLQSLLLILLGVFTTTKFLGNFVSYLVPFISILFVACIFTIISAIGSIAFGTMFQKIVPKDKLGRVTTVMATMCGAAMPLGQGVFGYTFEEFPMAISILVGGGIMLISSIYAATVFREGAFTLTRAVGESA